MAERLWRSRKAARRWCFSSSSADLRAVSRVIASVEGFMRVALLMLTRTDTLGAADGAHAQARHKNDERDPEQVGAEKVEHLHPGGGEESDVCDSKRVLDEKQAGNSDRQPAIGCQAYAVIDQPEQEGSGDEADGGMHPAEADEPPTAAGEILRDRGAETGGGEKSVAEGGK